MNKKNAGERQVLTCFNGKENPNGFFNIFD